jgi:hypothetical protein
MAHCVIFTKPVGIVNVGRTPASLPQILHRHVLDRSTGSSGVSNAGLIAARHR